MSSQITSCLDAVPQASVIQCNLSLRFLFTAPEKVKHALVFFTLDK